MPACVDLMNIQTSPKQLDKNDDSAFPGAVDDPIRAVFLPEDRLRMLGESLASAVESALAYTWRTLRDAEQPGRGQFIPRRLPLDFCS